MQVLVVDAFATEPMAGRPVAVLPDADPTPTDDQARAVAAELGATGTLLDGPDGLRHVGRENGASGAGDATVAGSVAAGSLVDRDCREPGTVPVAGTRFSVTVEADGTAGLELAVSHDEAGVATGRIAGALGVDPAALRDVGADLPPARVVAGSAVLAVPVNFSDHLAQATPDPAAVAGLLDDADATAVYAFSFDTLSADADWLARVFAPGGELAVSARGAAGCGVYGLQQGAFDAGTDTLVAASGGFLDRPSRVTVDPSGERTDDSGRRLVRVSGHSTVAFDGSVTLPPADDDDIIRA
ncbi:MAG: PhzF family phenazine biosynthesis protein [Salinirussus sp.]